MGAVHLRFGLPAHRPAETEALVKRADQIAAYFEATQLAGFTEKEARKFFSNPRGAKPPRLIPLATTEAQAHYLERFQRLSA
jgi:hypothetical protein